MHIYVNICVYARICWLALEIKSLVRVAIQEGYRTKPVSATRSLAMRDGRVEWTLRPSDCSARPQAMHRCGIVLGFKERPKIPYRNVRPYEALAIPPVGVGRTRVTALHRAARPCIALVARGEIKRNHPRGYTRRNSQRSATWDFFQVIPRMVCNPAGASRPTLPICNQSTYIRSDFRGGRSREEYLTLS